MDKALRVKVHGLDRLSASRIGLQILGQSFVDDSLQASLTGADPVEMAKIARTRPMASLKSKSCCMVASSSGSLMFGLCERKRCAVVGRW